MVLAMGERCVTVLVQGIVELRAKVQNKRISSHHNLRTKFLDKLSVSCCSTAVEDLPHEQKFVMLLV